MGHRFDPLVRLADRLVPWVVGVFLTMVAFDVLGQPGERVALAASLVLALIQAAALTLRRRAPVAATAVTLAAALPFQLLAPEIVLPVAAWVAMWSLTVARPVRISLVGLIAVTGISAISFTSQPAEDPIFAMIVGIGLWAVAEAIRNNRNASLAETRREIAEERAHLARELHDVLAHSISVIVVQAAAAGDVFDARPDQARTALGVIEQQARDALDELRRVLGASPPGDSGPAPPQPGIDRVDELADRIRSAGIDVAIRREGRKRPLPPGVDLSAYRIVQEALTNTLRHSHASRVEVTLRYASSEVEVEVRDNGQAPARRTTVEGRGLHGMRERAGRVGGTLEAGPLPEGGYRVAARLPCRGSR